MSDNTLYQLPLTIELKAPTLFANTVGDENMICSVDYIPGSVLLGAFAGMYIKKHGSVDHSDTDKFSQFATLFLKDQVRFLNGYIQIEKTIQPDSEETEFNQEPVTVYKRSLPVPLSIQYGKKEKAPAEEKLFRQAKGENGKLELVTFNYLLKEPSEMTENSDSPQNGVEPTKYYGGYCLLETDGELLTITTANVARQYQIHHKRTNQRAGRSTDAEIYNYESILPRQIFKAIVVGPNEKLNELKTLLQENDNIMRLGRSRHTQYGNAEVIAGNIKPYQDETDFLQTTRSLKNQFILTCTSDVVFDQSITKICIEEITQMIKTALSPKDTDLKCLNAFFKINTVERYNATWKARTPSQFYLVKGSCFVFELNPGMNNDFESAFEKIQQNGIGLRRNEGYGRVLINWQGLPLAEDFEGKTNTLEEPEGGVAPDTVLPLLQGLLKQWLVEKAQVYASKIVEKETDDKGFTKLTSTQLNKLKRMALDAKDFSDFKPKIGQLTNKGDLENIYFQNMSFYNFLCFDHFACLKESNWIENDKDTMFSFKIIEHSNNNDELKKILKHANSTAFLQNAKLQKSLFQTFYDTLFTLLDKSTNKNIKQKNMREKTRGEKNHE